MSLRTILGRVFQVPGQLLLIASFVGSIYAAYNKIAGITYLTPIILGIVVFAYIIGWWLVTFDDPKEEKINVPIVSPQPIHTQYPPRVLNR
jgi:hypothetical protein